MSSAKEITEKKKAWLTEKMKQLSPSATESGIPVQVLYTPDDTPDLDYLRYLGFPGDLPFTRGPYPSMYRGRLWTIRQYAGMGTAEDSNKRYKYLLDHGQTGLSVAFDLPTQLGYDSDHPLAQDEVGMVGVAVNSIRDMEILFDGIPLEKVTTHLNINATAPIILAMFIAVAEKQGVKRSEIRGTIQNDIIKEYLARKAYVFPPEPSLRLVGDTIEFCIRQVPNFNPISITGFHARELGASAIQELAFTLSAAIAYSQEVIRRGISFDEFAENLSFHFACARDFFEEVAKFRAARRLWARIAKERFEAKNPESCRLRFFSGGSGAVLTSAEPLNNIMRSTLQCLASVLGGAQAIHVMSYDEAHAIPTEESARLSVRTQQIIAYESGVTKTVDPLAGSYYVEYLTNELERLALDKIHEIDKLGGIVEAVKRGILQREIIERAYRTESLIEKGEMVFVGVNTFKSDTETEIRIQKPDPQTLQRQVQRLGLARQERDNNLVGDRLASVRDAAKGSQNIMPTLIDAVKAYATIGEVTNVLTEVFGEHVEPSLF